jgi:hypothetical protein
MSYHSLQKVALAVAAQGLVSTTVQNDIVTGIIVKDQRSVGTLSWFYQTHGDEVSFMSNTS